MPAHLAMLAALFLQQTPDAAPPAVETGSDGLRERIEARIAAVPGAVVGVSFRDLRSGPASTGSLDIAGDTLFHAASTMKVPVMIEVFRRIDAGALALEQPILLVNAFHSIVDGSLYALSPSDDSDSALYSRIGTRVTVRELMTRMIDRSSNLATNAVIALVGADRANATARELGATTMRVLRGVEDGKAYERGLNNQTSARDLATLLAAIEQGRAASRRSCDAMRAILLGQRHNGEIPAGLPPGTPVAHKTGWITGVLHDAAIVYPPGREPYVVVVLTRGIPERETARRLIADIAGMVHGHVTATPEAAIGAR